MPLAWTQTLPDGYPWTCTAQTQLGSVQAYDATPAGISVSPTSYVVGTATGFTISGQNLGTNCPQLTWPFPTTNQSFLSCGNSQVTGNITATGVASGDLQYTAEGYGGQGWMGGPGQNPTAPSQTTVASSCIIPTGETSTYIGKETEGGGYTAEFNATLAGSGTYTGRQTYETFIWGSGTNPDSCYFNGSQKAQLPEGQLYGNWTVQARNTYGIDYVGAQTTWADYYQQLIVNKSASYTSCGWNNQQQMSIDTCGIGKTTYDVGHTLSFTITATSMTSVRGTASGAAK